MLLNDIFKDERKLIEASRAGITKKDYSKIVKSTGLTLELFALMTHITSRTLQRKKPEEKISPEASERAILIGKLYFKGQQVFGEMEKFQTWMSRENLALGRKKPKELLDTIIGIGILQDELLRIEYGIVA
jgi:putative toxin-antitoxin system antitoxin component (TIGR02293 family)